MKSQQQFPSKLYINNNTNDLAMQNQISSLTLMKSKTEKKSIFNNENLNRSGSKSINNNNNQAVSINQVSNNILQEINNESILNQSYNNSSSQNSIGNGQRLNTMPSYLDQEEESEKTNRSQQYLNTSPFKPPTNSCSNLSQYEKQNGNIKVNSIIKNRAMSTFNGLYLGNITEKLELQSPNPGMGSFSPIDSKDNKFHNQICSTYRQKSIVNSNCEKCKDEINGLKLLFDSQKSKEIGYLIKIASLEKELKQIKGSTNLVWNSDKCFKKNSSERNNMNDSDVKRQQQFNSDHSGKKLFFEETFSNFNQKDSREYDQFDQKNYQNEENMMIIQQLVLCLDNQLQEIEELTLKVEASSELQQTHSLSEIATIEQLQVKYKDLLEKYYNLETNNYESKKEKLFFRRKDLQEIIISSNNQKNFQMPSIMQAISYSCIASNR